MSVIKTVILCGGMGTRMKEETELRPKPLVHVGERPILWHIMKIYKHYGHNNFIFALGYKSEMIKNYFLRQRDILNDFTLDISTNRIDFHNNNCDEFKITFAETGLDSHTGERLLRIKKYINENEFMVTYGDGVSDVDLNELVKFHREQKTIGTITGVHPHAKYGFVKIHDNSNLVQNFEQKPVMFDYVNGGFMIFNKEAFDYFDEMPMENGLIKLAQAGQLSVYKHDGFWKAMDTYREVLEMNDLWKTSKPWSVWEKL